MLSADYIKSRERLFNPLMFVIEWNRSSRCIPSPATEVCRACRISWTCEGIRRFSSALCFGRTGLSTQNQHPRRYLQHVLPHGFVRIRQFGFLANSQRALGLTFIRHVIGNLPRAPSNNSCQPAVCHCPRCGRAMRIGPPLSPATLRSLCRAFDSFRPRFRDFGLHFDRHDSA